MKYLRTLFLLITLGALSLSMQGCAFLAGAATGAAGAEVAEDEGYDLDSPIDEEDDDG